MFAVGKAKEHVYSLATQLLLQGSAAGAAVAVAGHHHHHHHYHARQLSTSAAGKPGGPNSCLSPSHQPQQHQPQPMVPELTLEDVSLFRMQEFRLLFLARCCQLHALADKAQIVLSARAYETLTDVLRVILREANNEGDFLAARLVHALSDMVGTYVGVYLQSARVPLRRHEAWGNPELYRVTLEECVARDKQQWLGLQAPLQELLGLEGGSVRGEDVIRLLLLLRLRAIAEAIVQLRRSPLEHEALVQGLLDHCRDAHGQAFTLEEVYAPPSAHSMLWLLDAATRFLDGPAMPTFSDSSSGSSPHVIFDEPLGRFDTLRRGPSGTAAAVSSSSIPNVLRWASETVRAAAHWACLGFSVHHALLHHVVGRSAAASSKNPFYMAPPAAGGGPGLANAAAASSSSSMGLVGAGVCLCGKPFYPEWRVLGGYRAETERVRQLAPSLLCEPCFRALLREQPLHDAAAGAAPVPHRPPQAVGCAPLPTAAEIRTPHSVAALAAAAIAVAACPPAAPEEADEPPRPNSTTTTVVVGLTEPREPLPPAPSQPLPEPARERASTPGPGPDLSSSALSSSSAAAAAATKPPAPLRALSNSKGTSSLLERECGSNNNTAADSMRRRSISASGARARASTSIAPAPAPPRPQSTRESSVSHLGASASSSISSSRLSVSGSSGGGAGKDGRPRLRKGELFALLMSGELEVLKHVQTRFAGFGMGAAPHLRILFVESSSTEASQLQWCTKEEFAKRQRGGGKRATMARGGLPLKHLLDVRRGEGPGKERVVTLLFQERPLVVEAFTTERADLLEAVFRVILAKNRKLTLGK